MNYNIKYGYSESVHLKTSVLNFDFISVFGSASTFQKDDETNLEDMKTYSGLHSTVWDFESSWVWPDCFVC